MPAMRQNLRVPGPTPLPDTVREAQAAPMINHRGPEFGELLLDVTARLRRLLATEAEVLILTGSGTGALEAAVVNTLSPGDRVLAATIGAFGDRFASIAEAFGADVTRLSATWGEATDPEALERALRDPSEPYRAVLLTHNETSTGVCNDIRRLAGTVRSAPGEPLVIVDGISGLGALPFEVEAWGVDLVVTASQKAWMGSPGIAMAVVTDRARAAGEQARMPRYYWDFAEARRWAADGQTPWTPAVSVLYGLRVGLERLEAEGREHTWGRHEAIGEAARAGVQALGLELVAGPGHRSNTVTAAWLPEGTAWGEVSAAARAQGLVVAGGQGALKGRILRIGHMGEVSLDDILDALDVLRHLLPRSSAEVDPRVEARTAYQRALPVPVG